MGNPYRGIFLLDEEIGSARTEEELYVIRQRVLKNNRYNYKTKRTICLWILDKVRQIRNEDD